MSRLPSRLAIIVALMLASLSLATGTAHPTFAATTTNIGCPNYSTLASDIATAGSGDVLQFNCFTTTTISFGGTITFGNAVTLDGSTSPGHVTLDGGSGQQLFVVNSGVTVGLTALTLSRGHTSIYGGAIYNDGTVTVTNSTFSGNYAYGSALGYGGAIYNVGTATVTNSTFSGNFAYNGGAIYNAGTATVANSTFSQNTANSYGGAIYNIGTVTVTNSTFSGNSAGNQGGAISNQGGTVKIGSSLSGSQLACAGIITDLGYNLVADGSCLNGGTGDIQSASPGLDPYGLQDNGGPTQTIALQSGSPAIDQIPTSYNIPGTTTPLCPTADQRGMTRPDNSETTCDIGAYEFAGITVSDCPATESALQTDITNAGAGGTVAFNCSTATTISFGGTITIGNAVTLDGSTSQGHVTLDGGGAQQLFVVNSGVTVGLTTLTLSNGYAFADGGTPSENCGGAIYNDGTVTVTNSTFSGNHAYNFGGAICSGSGTVTVFNSTFSGNGGGSGGGAIYNDSTVIVTNSTFSGNLAGADAGGAIFNDSLGTMGVTNSTFSGNEGSFGSYYGETIVNNGTLRIGGSVISSLSGSQLACAGIITDLGYNLVADGSCFHGGTGDIQSASPGLDPKGLQDNGGPTQTIALQSGSPAIDQISTSDATLCPTSGTDQRGAGYPRPDNSETNCDIGAYEYQDAGGVTKQTQSISFTSTAPTAAVTGDQYTPTATATSGLTVTFGASGACSYSAGTVTMTGAGTCTVNANQAGNSTYQAAAQVTQSFTVAKASQTISFGALSAQLSNATPLAVSATGGASGNPVTFAASPAAVCTAGGTNGSTITIGGVGTCTVTASQAGTTNYLAAPDVSHNFSVTAPQQSTTLSVAPASGAYGGKADLSATRPRRPSPSAARPSCFRSTAPRCAAAPHRSPARPPIPTGSPPSPASACPASMPGPTPMACPRALPATAPTHPAAARTR
jgi:predicted outer membrane repeat protein